MRRGREDGRTKEDEQAARWEVISKEAAARCGMAWEMFWGIVSVVICRCKLPRKATRDGGASEGAVVQREGSLR